MTLYIPAQLVAVFLENRQWGQGDCEVEMCWRMERAFSPMGGGVLCPGALPQAGIGRAVGPMRLSGSFALPL